ncbi:hypothetical protein [Stenotrophomonas maltophilia]|uniref:hypothetical protein n=1 Tax=Stenotrophomonas maltophilia TaxID=40324 RepID=UPI000A84DB14|nr:hypothetical protein [Stenotrophomonas maltophilia]
MVIELCPLAAEVGNLADWAGVAVGFGAAVATIVVAGIAQSTSRKATAIAEEAKGIARMQYDAAEALRRDNARILGRLLLVEVTTLPAVVAALARGWNQAIMLGDGTFGVADPRAFVQTLAEATLPFMPAAQAAEDRIHNLPNDLGADLASLIGAGRALNDLASRMQTKMRPGEDAMPVLYADLATSYLASATNCVGCCRVAWDLRTSSSLSLASLQQTIAT